MRMVSIAEKGCLSLILERLPAYYTNGKLFKLLKNNLSATKPAKQAQ